MRQIMLDTETTGLKPADGHRIIEIGCVELINREFTGNNFHEYINPERRIDAGALAVHGISNKFLKDKPRFSDIASSFLEYIKDAQIIIHNAPFDVGFINHEFRQLKPKLKRVHRYCQITDSLEMARKKHPGQKNSLDALCKRYKIDNSKRDLHGALLDADLLARVFLAMTGGQASLFSDPATTDAKMHEANNLNDMIKSRQHKVKIVKATHEECTLHDKYIEKLADDSGVEIWTEETESV